MNNEIIQTTALNLSTKYKEIYEQWSKENPGKVMHGASIKEESLRKASFAKSIEDLIAMKRCFEIEEESMKGEMNGFRFSVDAMEELINELQ